MAKQQKSNGALALILTFAVVVIAIAVVLCVATFVVLGLGIATAVPQTRSWARSQWTTIARARRVPKIGRRYATWAAAHDIGSGAVAAVVGVFVIVGAVGSASSHPITPQAADRYAAIAALNNSTHESIAPLPANQRTSSPRTAPAATAVTTPLRAAPHALVAVPSTQAPIVSAPSHAAPRTHAPAVVVPPTHAASPPAHPSTNAPAPASATMGGPYVAGCTPDYPDFCIPYEPYNAYNCADIPANDFSSTGSDPYRLDADNDGIACES